MQGAGSIPLLRVDINWMIGSAWVFSKWGARQLCPRAGSEAPGRVGLVNNPKTSVFNCHFQNLNFS
jgi:hypothetical protein